MPSMKVPLWAANQPSRDGCRLFGQSLYIFFFTAAGRISGALLSIGGTT